MTVPSIAISSITEADSETVISQLERARARGDEGDALYAYNVPPSMSTIHIGPFCRTAPCMISVIDTVTFSVFLLSHQLGLQLAMVDGGWG